MIDPDTAHVAGWEGRPPSATRSWGLGPRSIRRFSSPMILAESIGTVGEEILGRLTAHVRRDYRSPAASCPDERRQMSGAADVGRFCPQAA